MWGYYFLNTSPVNYWEASPEKKQGSRGGLRYGRRARGDGGVSAGKKGENDKEKA
jgi:hypothetical protein